MSVFRQKAPILIDALLAQLPALQVLDAAAIAGNAGHESAGFTKLQEMKPTVKGSRGGFGWFQWTGPRRRNFEAWCKKHGMNPSSDQANIGFLIHELRTTEAHAIPRMLAAATLEGKVKAFELAYERAGVKHYYSRIQFARQALAAHKAVYVPLPRPKPTMAKLVPDEEPKRPLPDDPGVEVPFERANITADVADIVAPEPTPLSHSSTIWSAISAFAASGASMIFAYINSWYGVVALAIVAILAAWIIRERIRHRRENGV